MFLLLFYLISFGRLNSYTCINFNNFQINSIRFFRFYSSADKCLFSHSRTYENKPVKRIKITFILVSYKHVCFLYKKVCFTVRQKFGRDLKCRISYLRTGHFFKSKKFYIDHFWQSHLRCENFQRV